MVGGYKILDMQVGSNEDIISLKRLERSTVYKRVRNCGTYSAHFLGLTYRQYLAGYLVAPDRCQSQQFKPTAMERGSGTGTKVVLLKELPL